MLKSLLTTAAAAALLTGAAQAQETQAEDPAITQPQAEAPLEQAGDEAGQALDDAAQATGDAAEEAGEMAQESVEETGDAMEEAATVDEPLDADEPVTIEADGSDETMIEAETEMAPMADDDMATTATDFGTPAEGWTQIDPSTLLADNLLGAEITNLEDEQVASVGDVVLTADGQVEGVVAEFGGFLGFGENTVMLSMDEIDFIRSGEDEIVVRTNLTPEDLEARPAYEPEIAPEG